jgi:hypothetical protein
MIAAHRTRFAASIAPAVAILLGICCASRFGVWIAEAAQQPSPVPSIQKLVPLNKQETVLLDKEGKRVLLKSKVVLREGLLEMLCCLKQTKEHESILAVDAEARIIHAGLLAIGAEAGRPVQFYPNFVAPQGQVIDVFLQWRDEQGKLRREPAQTWIRTAVHRFYVVQMDRLPVGLVLPDDSELRYDDKHHELIWYGPMTAAQRDRLLGLSQDKDYQAAVRSFFDQTQPKQMDARWVFAGSEFQVDERNGEQIYLAESGDLICVANFPSATLDVSIASSASGAENLLYEAWTERIPPLGTEVTIELIPAPKPTPR